MKNCALIAAVVIVLAGASAHASVNGSSCTTSDPFIPGATTTMCWTCTNAGPLAGDPECLEEAALGYPDGWAVACGTQDAADSSGSPVELGCSAGGQTVTFSDLDGGAGEICPEQSWGFCVDVTAPAAPAEPVCVFYTLTGDGAGGEPHAIIDCETVQVAPGTVTIVKETAPADAAGQTFGFAGDLGSFSLAGGEMTTVADLVPGSYTVTESRVAGWDLSQLTCLDPDGGTTVDLAAGTASLDVDPGEEVTCTFVNTARGSVTVVKETEPEDSGGQLFEFAGDLGSFSLAGGEMTTVADLVPGSYSVAESATAGWDLSQLTCVDPDGGTAVDLAAGTASLDVDPGEEVTCTFVNTARGSVTVVKETDPVDAGGQEFEFTGDFGVLSLTGGEATTIPDLVPGSYSVAESATAGWDLSQLTCVDPDGGTTVDLAAGTASLDVDPGEEVTCTFVNTAQGSVTIVKETDPVDAGGQLFEFAGDLGAFSLTGGGTTTISNLAPGSYTVAEGEVAGWDLSQLTCVDPDGGTTVDLAAGTAILDVDPGEEVTCTFVNTAQGSVTIVKETDPVDAGGQLFEFVGDLGPITLVGGESTTRSSLAPGSYVVTESLPEGWDLSQLTCDDPDGGSTVDLPSGTATVDLDSGEQVTCTFLNSAQGGSVTIVKQTVTTDMGAGQQFPFTGDLGTFTLAGGESTTRAALEPGTYTVAESLPDGWDLSQLTCDDPDGGTVVDLVAGVATVDVDSGEEVVCTFVNTALGSVTITKQTEPANAGGVFEFSGDLGSFTLAGGESTTRGDLSPGVYLVSESLPAGWELGQLTCTDPDGGTTVSVSSGTASVDVDAGEQVLCTFVNTASAAASVTIVKETYPHASGGPFEFSGDLGLFSLGGGQSTAFSELSPGSYEVIEAPPGDDWELIGITCDDPDGGSSYSYDDGSVIIDLDSGEQITCTFINREDGYQAGPPIPTLSPWMLLLLVAVVSGAGVLLLRGRAAG